MIIHNTFFRDGSRKGAEGLGLGVCGLQGQKIRGQGPKLRGKVKKIVSGVKKIRGQGQKPWWARSKKS